MERDQYWPCSPTCDESGTENSAPARTVDRAAWEKLGGVTVATADPLGGKAQGEGTKTDRTSIGTLPLGKGRIVVFGALLPQPTENYDHWFGVNAYTVSIPGQQLLLRALRWSGGPLARPAGARSAAAGAASPSACRAARPAAALRARLRQRQARARDPRPPAARPHRPARPAARASPCASGRSRRGGRRRRGGLRRGEGAVRGGPRRPPPRGRSPDRPADYPTPRPHRARSRRGSRPRPAGSGCSCAAPRSTRAPGASSSATASTRTRRRRRLSTGSAAARSAGACTCGRGSRCASSRASSNAGRSRLPTWRRTTTRSSGSSRSGRPSSRPRSCASAPRSPRPPTSSLRRRPRTTPSACRRPCAPRRATGRLTLRPHAVVRRVRVERGRATGVAFIDARTGREEEARGEHVVLCASTIETLRILLASDRLGDAAGLLGVVSWITC